MQRGLLKRQGSRRAPAQALVEFALASTLIFFLLAAAVDLGLIFFTLQALRTAAQEGATYGSYPVPVYDNGGTDVYAPSNPSGMTLDRIDFNYPEIINRVYGSGGEGAITGFANLRNLDNDEFDDFDENLHASYSNPEDWIFIENLKSTTGTPVFGQSYGPCRGNVPGSDLQNGGRNCFLRVTVSYNYRFLFPLAPAFGGTVRLRSSQVIPVRSSFFTN